MISTFLKVSKSVDNHAEETEPGQTPMVPIVVEKDQEIRRRKSTESLNEDVEMRQRKSDEMLDFRNTDPGMEHNVSQRKSMELDEFNFDREVFGLDDNETEVRSYLKYIICFG